MASYLTPIPTGNPPITQDWFGIWYQPMKDEVDLAKLEIVKTRELKAGFVIPPTRNLTLTLSFVRRGNVLNKSVYIFVPGQKFDKFGTRHGRGGGWYDRFLAACPREWLRIGICGPGQWSDETLIRQAWDQEMDWVITVPRSDVNSPR